MGKGKHCRLDCAVAVAKKDCQGTSANREVEFAISVKIGAYY